MKATPIILAGWLVLSASAMAQDRAFTLDGRVLNLNPDGTWKLMAKDSPAGKLVFSLSGGRSTGSRCSLEASLHNKTTFPVQYLKQCFKVFGQRASDTVCFNFGGNMKSDRIEPSQSAAAVATFRRGPCEALTGAEPHFLFEGRDPSDVNLVGLAPNDARKLFHFSKAGLISIGKPN